MTDVTPPRLPPDEPPWVVIWPDADTDGVRWEASTDLPHWQLVGLLESARRAVDGW
jgi:hypothetical protein